MKAGKAAKKLGNLQLANQYFLKGFELNQDPSLRKEMEETQLLLKYLIEIETDYKNKDYKEA